MTKKRRRSLRIFSTHITRNAIEIDVSAPFASRAIITQRAPVPALLNGLTVVAGTANAVAAGGIEAQRAASFSSLNGAAAVATRARYAVAAGAVVTQRTPSHFWATVAPVAGPGHCLQSRQLRLQSQRAEGFGPSSFDVNAQIGAADAKSVDG